MRAASAVIVDGLNSAQTSHRCRLCTANDVEAVIEQLAEDLWESRRGGTLDDWPWAEAGDYWRRTFRGFAVTAVASLAGNTARRGSNDFLLR